MLTTLEKVIIAVLTIIGMIFADERIEYILWMFIWIPITTVVLCWALDETKDYIERKIDEDIR